jgi:ElaA protein
VSSELHWVWRPFSALGGRDVHDVLRLRAAVFVVEQRCAYQDPDSLDLSSHHCLGRAGPELAAYLRSMPPREGAAYSALGRIVVDPAYRGRDLGRELVRRGIAFNRGRWPGRDIRIAAQAHLTALYESLGFVSENDLFLEDGIEHVHMRLPAC